MKAMRQRYIRNRRGQYLLNQYGQPLTAAYGFYEAARYPNRYSDNVNPVYGTGSGDWRGLLNPSEWRRLIAVARKLFVNSPILHGALLEQATLSFPLEPQYVGKDRAWGRKAEAWLYEWRKNANVRGYPYDGEATSRIRLLGRKVDGDVGTLLTENDDGSPAVRIFPAHQIGDREWQTGMPLEQGKYKGMFLDNGVIHDGSGRVVAYRLLGKTLDEDIDVPAGSLFLSFKPLNTDQFRGASEMCASITDFQSVQRLREYELRAQQIQSAYALVETNETGEPQPPGADFLVSPDSGTSTAGTGSGLQYRVYEGGLHQYFKAEGGGGLQLVKPDRPGPDSQNFEDRIIAAALYGIEWDPNFAMAIKEPGGAWARAIIEKVRRCIASNQRIEANAQHRENTYALSVVTENGGFPMPADGDLFSWVYQGPERITADSGNEESIKNDQYKLGLRSLKEMEAEKGKWWEEVREQREQEIDDLLARATRLQSKYPELSLAQVMELMEQRSPNPAVASAPKPQVDSPNPVDETKPGSPIIPGRS